MKRLLSLITILCVLTACISFPVNISAQTVYGEEAFKLLSALKIMVGDDDGAARLEDNMTRAEFAQLLKNIVNYSSGETDEVDNSKWQSSFFGTDTEYNELKYPQEGEASAERFTDLTESHWGYEAVMFAVSVGLMKGTSENTFHPDNFIKTNEVTKCLMLLLGYADIAEADGGYPDGYIKHAQRLKLFKNTGMQEYITRGSIAQMIENCMDVSMLEISGIGTSVTYDYSSDKTFATEILGIEKITGLMSDNGYTSIIGESSYEGKNIVVNNVLLRVEEGDDFTQFIGRDVDCYYKNSKTDDLGVVIHVSLSERDRVTSIDGEDVDSLSTTDVIYYSSDSGMKKCDISNAYIIYNGMALTGYTADVFDIDFGSVEVVETNSQQYKKIVIINSFETWYVSNVDTTEAIIYNSLKTGEYISESDILDLETDEKGYKISVFYSDGTQATVSDISKGCVLDILRSDKVITIYISQKSITDFYVQSIAEDEGTLILSDGEAEYELAAPFMNYYGRQEIRLGDTLTLYLNLNNQIAWAVNQADSDLFVAYMLESGKNNRASAFTTEIGTRVYDMSDAINTYMFADRITVSDSTGDVNKIDSKDYLESYGSYTGICRYGLDDDDKVNYIEFPILDSDTTINGKLHLIMESTADNKDSLGYFRADVFGGKALINASSRIICYNPTASEDIAFDLAGYEMFDDKSENVVKLYSDVEGSFVGKYVIYETDTEIGDFNTATLSPQVYVVKKIYGGKFPDESTGDIISASGFKMKELEDEALYLEDGVLDSIETEAEVEQGEIGHAAFTGKLEPGDIIRVTKNADGLVSKIRIIWDENGKASTAATPGMFPGMKSYYDVSEDYNTNPFAYSSSSALLTKAKGFSSGSFRAFYGFPYKVREGAVKITTYDIPANGYSSTINEEVYLSEAWNALRVIVVDLTEDGKVTVKKGSASDIRPYDEFGKDCSRIVNITRFATVTNMVVINGYYHK